MLTKADIDWLKDEFLPELAQSVQDGLKDKLDEISTKLDKFVGEIQDKRTVQELHDQDHVDLKTRVEVLEKHSGIQAP